MSSPSLTSTLNLLSVPLASLPKSFWLWGAHAPSLWVETKPRIYSGMPHATLRESYLIMASDNCFSFPLSCLMSLFPETAIGEWRFHVAKNVPVPVNGSDLEVQVMANPSSMCHASRLCLPLPYPRCQDTFSASSMVSPRVLCLCLPSLPGLTWTLPPMKNL
jgi:hypothetical protein